MTCNNVVITYDNTVVKNTYAAQSYLLFRLVQGCLCWPIIKEMCCKACLCYSRASNTGTTLCVSLTVPYSVSTPVSTGKCAEWDRNRTRSDRWWESFEDE